MRGRILLFAALMLGAVSRVVGLGLEAGGTHNQGTTSGLVNSSSSLQPPASRLAVPATLSGACATTQCHADIYALAVKHGPVIKGKCEPCHIPIGNRHEFEARGGTIVCRDCHLEVPPGKDRHASADTACLECHDPHGAATKIQPAGSERFFMRRRSTAGLCLDCHKELAARQPRHPFTDSDGCLACHELHHAAGKPLLKAPRGEVCLRCHDDLRRGLAGKNGSVHEPVTQDCTKCHLVHGGAKGPALTAQAAPGLCANCHAELVRRALAAKFPHQPVSGEKSCDGCHDPHFARGRALLKTTTRDLCLGCHDRTYTLNDGFVLADVKAQVTQSKYVHGPARQGSCTPCHDAHGSDFPRLLKYDFPCAFYAPFKEDGYELCFRCHNRRMVFEPQSDVTRFRNGSRNLHYLHVNQDKGRTCRACHHEHASDSPLRIRPSVPFGKWVMPLVYKKTEDGGSCRSSCHNEYGYNRKTPVTNPVSEREINTKK